MNSHRFVKPQYTTYMQQSQVDKKSLKGKKVAISGTFKNLKHKDVEVMIKKLGAMCSGNVTASTNYLVQGSGKKYESKKLRQAEKMKIPIIDLNWLEKRCKEINANGALEKTQPVPVPDNRNTILSRPFVPDLAPLNIDGTTKIGQGNDTNESCTFVSLTVARPTIPVPECEIRNSQEGLQLYQPPARPVKRLPLHGSVFVPHRRYQESDGHFIGSEVELLAGKYQLVSGLGQGGYAKVFEAKDITTGKSVAIKVSKAGQTYRWSASNEIRVLKTLRANSDNHKKQIINFQAEFEYLGHNFIVLELLSLSLCDFLKDNEYAPFPNSQIQSVNRQILVGLAFLQDLGIIHADLKPGNIVLCNRAYQTFTYRRTVFSTWSETRYDASRRVLLDPEIRLIDFGLASFYDEESGIHDGSYPYCAPEVRLRLKSTFARDIWSLGCILLELFTGRVAFSDTSLPDYLAIAEAVTGSDIDDAWLGAQSQDRDVHCPSLKSSVLASRERLRTEKVNDLNRIVSRDNSFLEGFQDLIRSTLTFNPDDRIQVREALRHVWVTGKAPPDDGTVAAKIRRQ
ncbi:cmgc clk protein kinase [Fusarium langsethiae]|uniref:Cmgc clk protein kinase n=1 Tax=Fusarium langsethiae TaxID=179993 RepID=A0A0M9EQQ3_FUSLA|nr:cmgc clk protein kinase [Fusarium langsethiae]GKU08580.1 unnamed protein product [Fusarium langsethiae]